MDGGIKNGTALTSNNAFITNLIERKPSANCGVSSPCFSCKFVAYEVNLPLVTITILCKIAMRQFFHRLIMPPNLPMFKEIDSQEQPAKGIRNGAVIPGGKEWGGHTHVMIEVLVCQQIK